MGLNLHTHLEGCVRPETAAELAATAGVPDPPGGWERALRMDHPADLTVFLAHVAAVYPVLGSPDALRRVAREAVEDAAADGCHYLEIRFGPATHRRPGFDLPAVVAAACAGLQEGTAATGLPAGLVVAMLRHTDPETNLAVSRAAAGAAGKGVVGLDIAGDELVYPSQAPYREGYAIAGAAGLGLTAHAAEAGPPSSVVDAVDILGVSSDRARVPGGRRPRHAGLGGGTGDRIRSVPDLEPAHRGSANHRRSSDAGDAGRRVPRGPG